SMIVIRRISCCVSGGGILSNSTNCAIQRAKNRPRLVSGLPLTLSQIEAATLDCELEAEDTLIAGRGDNLTQYFQSALGHLFRRPQTAKALVSARQETFFWPNEFGAARFERGGVLLCGGMKPHFAIHGRSDEEPGFGIQCQGNATQRIIGDAERKPGHSVGGCGRYAEEGGFIREVGMSRVPALLFCCYV